MFKEQSAQRVPRSVLFFGRFSPSKSPDVLVDAIQILEAQGVKCTASFFGSAGAHNASYRSTVQARAYALENVRFFEGVPHADAPRIYSAHQIYVDLAPSGMYDKTIFEAAACGCLVVAASHDYARIADPRLSFDGSAEDLAAKLKQLLELPEAEQHSLILRLKKLADEHSLPSLVRTLSTLLV